MTIVMDLQTGKSFEIQICAGSPKIGMITMALSAMTENE